MLMPHKMISCLRLMHFFGLLQLQTAIQLVIGIRMMRAEQKGLINQYAHKLKQTHTHVQRRIAICRRCRTNKFHLNGTKAKKKRTRKMTKQLSNSQLNIYIHFYVYVCFHSIEDTIRFKKISLLFFFFCFILFPTWVCVSFCMLYFVSACAIWCFLFVFDEHEPLGVLHK